MRHVLELQTCGLLFAARFMLVFCALKMEVTFYSETSTSTGLWVVKSQKAALFQATGVRTSDILMYKLTCPCA